MRALMAQATFPQTLSKLRPKFWWICGDFQESSQNVHDLPILTIRFTPGKEGHAMHLAKKAQNSIMHSFIESEPRAQIQGKSRWANAQGGKFSGGVQSRSASLIGWRGGVVGEGCYGMSCSPPLSLHPSLSLLKEHGEQQMNHENMLNSNPA